MEKRSIFSGRTWVVVYIIFSALLIIGDPYRLRNQEIGIIEMAAIVISSMNLAGTPTAFLILMSSPFWRNPSTAMLSYGKRSLIYLLLVLAQTWFLFLFAGGSDVVQKAFNGAFFAPITGICILIASELWDLWHKKA